MGKFRHFKGLLTFHRYSLAPAVPSGNGVRCYAHEIRQNNQLIDEGGFQNTMVQPSTRGCDHRLM
jgi:hypothetical protein